MVGKSFSNTYDARESDFESDIRLNLSKLDPSAVTTSTISFNKQLQNLEAQGSRWYEIGVEKYRQMRKSGLTPLPGATPLPSAETITIPSREESRNIPCRVLRPIGSRGNERGIFLHFHGGGWVLNDEESSDTYLQEIATSCQLICVSVGYRLAPEHPFPAGPNDCFDVAKWLIEHAYGTFGTRLAFLGGESAGANLALVTTLTLLRSSSTADAELFLDGLILHYGTFSLHWQPGTRAFHKSPTLVLDEESLSHFREAYLPAGSPDITSPEVSPFYANLQNLKLPPLLLTCGTEDCLLEDSIFMSTRWLLAGGVAVLKLLPGSPHGYILFPPQSHENAAVALRYVARFVSYRSSSKDMN